MWSAICFNLDQSEILSSGNGLMEIRLRVTVRKTLLFILKVMYSNHVIRRNTCYCTEYSSSHTKGPVFESRDEQDYMLHTEDITSRSKGLVFELRVKRDYVLQYGRHYFSY